MSSASPLDEYPGQFRAYGGYRNLDLVVWTGRITFEGAQHISAFATRRYRELGKRVSTVHLMGVDARLGLPDQATRSELVEMRKQHRHTVGCLAVVIEAGGMWGSAVRGLINSLVAVSPQRYSLTIAGSLREAAQWLPKPHARATGVELDPEELSRYIESVRIPSGREAAYESAAK